MSEKSQPNGTTPQLSTSGLRVRIESAKRVALLASGVTRLAAGAQGGSSVMLLEHRRVLEKAGWEVRVYGTVAKHELPVEQIAVHAISPRPSAYEYYWRFVRANPVGVLLAYDEPGVAMLAPSRFGQIPQGSSRDA